MTPEEFLSKPWRELQPRGIRGCLDCGHFDIHGLIYCHECGKPIKDLSGISIREALEKLGPKGPVVIGNAVFFLLKDIYPSFGAEASAIFAEVKRILKRPGSADSKNAV